MGILAYKSIWITSVLLFLLSCKTTQYLSDKDNTYRKIEDFQKNFNSGNFFLKKLNEKYFTKKNAYELLLKSTSSIHTFSFENNDSLKNREYKQMFKEYIPTYYPTRYQDPFEYLIFSPLIKNITKQGKVLYPSLNYVPKYGTFYANSIAAERKSFKDDYLLLIHSKYVTFCHQMGKVALQPFQVKNSSNGYMTILMDTATIMNSITANKEVNLNFFYTFLEFNYNGFPPNDSLFLNDSYFEKALQYWNNASETFLIGHEYAHALLKHRTSDADFLSDTILLKSWFNEVEADSVSQEISNQIVKAKTNNEYQIGWSKYLLAGGLFYLNTLQIFENGQSILDSNKVIPPLSKDDFNTILNILSNKSNMVGNLAKFNSLSPSIRKFDHPPTEIRIELIRRLYNKHTNEDLHQRDDFNLVEEFHEELAQKMIFALHSMNQASMQAFHNAYESKKLLNEKFKR